MKEMVVKKQWSAGKEAFEIGYVFLKYFVKHNYLKNNEV